METSPSRISAVISTPVWCKMEGMFEFLFFSLSFSLRLAMLTCCTNEACGFFGIFFRSVGTRCINCHEMNAANCLA